MASPTYREEFKCCSKAGLVVLRDPGVLLAEGRMLHATYSQQSRYLQRFL